MPATLVEKYGVKSLSWSAGADPLTVVGHDDPRPPAGLEELRLDDDLPDAAHGVDRVVDEVQHRTLEVVGIHLQQRAGPRRGASRG